MPVCRPAFSLICAPAEFTGGYMHDPLHIARESRLGGKMHSVYNVSKREALIRQEFLEFVSGVTVNPVPGRTAGNGLADFGKVFGGNAQFPGIPGYLPLFPAVFLDRHQETEEMAGGDVFNLRLLDFPRIDIPHVIEENGQREHWQEMAAKYNIQIESWFPLGGRDSHGEILRDPVINAIAKAHGKSAAQVIIRWHLQKGFCVVPGSSNPAHIQENIESFSFTLSDDEMKQIAALNNEKRYFNMSYEQIKAWMGDYELWD